MFMILSRINSSMIETTVMLLIPLSLVGWYLLLSDPTDTRSIWKRFHSIMKSSRLNKVIKNFL